jgi:hypothetical protein
MICKLCGSSRGKQRICGIVCGRCCLACREDDDNICPHRDFLDHGGVVGNPPKQPETYAEAQNNKAQTYFR